MEYKCNFCGKPYTDRNQYTECVMRCNELHTAREDEEKRKMAAETRTQRLERIKELSGELAALLKEERKTNPRVTENQLFKALGIDLSTLSQVLPPIHVYGRPFVCDINEIFR